MNALTDKKEKNKAKPVAGIILAAGSSRRMGRLKQMLPFQGKSLLAHTIEKGLAADLSPLILVLGHKADQIKERISKYPIDVIINPIFSDGMASSICTGLNHLTAIRKDSDTPSGAVFLLADQPLVTVETIQTISEKGRTCPGKIIIPVMDGRRGNPVYFDNCFFTAMTHLEGDIGGRALFTRFAHAVEELPVTDPGIFLDIDTPKAYEQLCQKEEK